MQTYSVNLKRCVKIGATAGALLGAVVVLLSAVIAYFVIEPNLGIMTHGIMKLVNFFHPLNPMILASSCITILIATLLGTATGYCIAKYIKTH